MYCSVHTAYTIPMSTYVWGWSVGSALNGYQYHMVVGEPQITARPLHMYVCMYVLYIQYSHRFAQI